MPLAFTHGLQADLTHFVFYRMRKYTVAGYDATTFTPVDTDDYKMLFEGGFWYEFEAFVSSGNGLSGSGIAQNALTGEYLPSSLLFLPAGGFRYPELDRAPWGSAEIRKAETNIALGGVTKSTHEAIWVNDNEEAPSFDLITTENTNISLSMALAGLKIENGQLRILSLNQVGDFATYSENTEKKFTISNLVKTYLDQRNNYEAFMINVLPAGIGSEVQPTSPYEAMKNLLAATAIDTRVWDDYAGGSNLILSGGLVTKSVEWSVAVPFAGGYAFFDLSGWTMNANSRVSPGVSSSRV